MKHNISAAKRWPHVLGVILIVLAASVMVVKMVAASGLPLYPTALVYYNDPSTGKAPGDSTTPNTFARAYAYRTNIDNQFSTTDSPPVGATYPAQDGDPAVTGWDVGSTAWSNINAGDTSMLVLEARNGQNAWTGTSWVGGARVVITQAMLNNLQIDYHDVVMEQIPTPTMQSNTTSSITIHWQGLWDNSTAAAGGSGPTSVIGYSLYRSVDGGAYSLFTNLAQAAGSNIAYTDSTTTPGHTYNYKLGVRFDWPAHSTGYYEPAAQSPASAPLTAGIPTPVMLKYLSAPPTLTAGTKSAVQTVQSSDASGNAANLTSDTVVDLTSDSSGANAKFFSVSGGVCTSTQITNVTILNGTSTAQFCYYDEKAGSWTLTAATTGLTSATQTATVNNDTTLGGLVLVLASPQKNRVAFTGTNTLTAKDAFGNTIVGFNPATDNITFTVAPGTAAPSGLDGTGAQLTVAGDFTAGVASVTSKLKLSGTSGSYTVTATSASGKSDNASVTLNAGALDHFSFALASPQTIAANFTGTNTLTARDIDNNTITNFDASTTNVTVTESAGSGTVAGLGSGNNTVLNQAGDFASGVANLTGSMKYTGSVGAHSFKATAGAVNSTSNSVSFNPGALSKFAVNLTTPQANASPFAAATITAQDVFGNTVTSFDASGDAVTLSSTGTGSLNTTSLSSGSSFVGGVANLSGSLTFTGLVGAHTITATSASGKTGSQVVTITPGTTLNSLTLVLASAQKNRIAFTGTNTLTAKDVSGNVMTGFSSASDNITFTVAPGTAVPLGLNGAANAQLTLAGDFASGVATLSGRLNLGGTSGSYTITATSASSKSDNANVVLSGGALDHFDFALASPQAIATNFTGTNTLTARDIDSNLITSFDASTTNVAVTESAGSGTVSGLGSGSNTLLNRNTDFVNGVANLTGAMKYTGLVGAHTFKATAGAVNTTSGSVSFNPGPLAKFAVAINMPQANAAAFTTATITAQDTFGNTVTSFDASADNVALSVSGTGSLSTTSLSSGSSFVGGVASLSGSLTFMGLIGAHTITATSASGKTGNAATTITAGAPTTAKIVNGSSSAATQVTTSSLNADQTLSLWAAGYDVSNNWTGLLSGTWSSSGTLAPAVTDSSVNTIVFAPTTAPASGVISFTGGSLSASTGTTTVTPGAFNHFVVAAPGTATAGQAFNVSITATDADGNTVVGYTGAQTIVFSQPGNAPGGGTPTYPASVTFTNGVASAVPVTLVKAETVKLKATQGGQTGLSGNIVVSAAAPNSFVVTAPSIAVAGVAFNTQITAYDQFGNADTGYTGSHTLVFANPGNAPDGTAPAYPASVNFASGVGTANVRLFSRETTTIKATEGAVTGTSGAIAVSSGPAATIAQVSGDHQSGPVSQALPLPAKVIVKDAYQNPKGLFDNYNVIFTVTAGNGSIATNTVPTATDGTAQVAWTMGSTPGTDNNTLQATGAGLTGSPVIFTASASGNGFVVTTPGTVNAGVPFAVQIKLIDMNGTTVTTYTGTKTLTFSGPSDGPNGDKPQYPVTVTFVNGVATPPNITLVAVGTTTLTAADTAAGLSGTSDPFTVNVGAPAKLTVVTAAQQIKANEVSGPITVCVQDQYGNAVLGAADRTLSLAGTSPGAKFSTSKDGPWASYQATLGAGLNCLDLFYRDGYAGARTVTISGAGLSEASQPIIITPTSEPPPSEPAVTTPPVSTVTPSPSTPSSTSTSTNTNTTNTIRIYTDRPTNNTSVPSTSPTTVVPLPTVQFPIITSPSADAFIAPIEGNVIFEGTAPPVQSLRILSITGSVLGSGTSDKSGQWRILVDQNKFKGAQQGVYPQLLDHNVQGASVPFALKQPTRLERVINFFTR